MQDWHAWTGYEMHFHTHLAVTGLSLTLIFWQWSWFVPTFIQWQMPGLLASGVEERKIGLDWFWFLKNLWGGVLYGLVARSLFKWQCRPP